MWWSIKKFLARTNCSLSHFVLRRFAKFRTESRLTVLLRVTKINVVDILRVRFGLRLKKLRKSKNLTQESLAEKTGLSVDFIGMIERGERAPSFETLEILAKILKVAIADFFIEEGT